MGELESKSLGEDEKQSVSQDLGGSRNSSTAGPGLESESKTTSPLANNVGAGTIDGSDISTNFYTSDSVSSGVFKTSNRILEDVRFDLYFILSSFNKGILGSKTVSYSTRLSKLNDKCYSVLTLSNDLDYAPFYEKVPSLGQPDTKVQELRSLLVNETLSRPLSDTAVYHLTIRMKRKLPLLSSNPTPKQQFYLIRKDELFEEDIKDLYLYDKHYFTDEKLVELHSSVYKEPEQSERILTSKLNALKNCVPELVDEATFISFDTQTLVRIEISKPVLGKEALEEFEVGRINSRNPKDAPTQSDCLKTLVKLIKGPLLYKDKETKAIKSSHKVIGSHVTGDFLVKYLHFYFDGRRDYVPINYLHFPDPALQALAKNWLIRVLFEILYLGSTVNSKKLDSKSKNYTKNSHFREFVFSKYLPIFYRMLNEFDIVSSIKYDSHYWDSTFNLSSLQLSFKNEDFINLSIFSFYSPKEIIENYTLLRNCDPKNVPCYFQSIKNIANLYKNDNNTFGIFLAKEMSIGIFGINDVTNAYKYLGLEVDNKPSADELNSACMEIDDDIILNAYKFQLLANPNLGPELKNSVTSLANFKRSLRLANYLNSELESLNEADDTLGITEQVDDDTVLIAYEVKANDEPENKLALAKSLLAIATYRRSHILLNFCEVNFWLLIKSLLPKPINEISEEECFAYLKVDPLATEYQIVTILDTVFTNENNEIIIELSNHAIDSPFFIEPLERFRKLRLYLRVLNQYKQSKLIGYYLENGKIHEKAIPLDQWPTGLDNIGNTCYLNSLLQYYFVIKPLRDQVLGFQKKFPTSYDEEVSSNSDYVNRRIGGRTVKYKEVERSYQFVYNLRDLFHNMIYSNSKDIIPSKELAYLAFSPITQEVEFGADDKVEEQDSLVIKVDTSDTEVGELRKEADPRSLRFSSSEDEGSADGKIDIDTDIAELEAEKENQEKQEKVTHNSTAVAKISFDQMNNALEIGRQQDVTECIENVLFQIEASLKPLFLEDDEEQSDIIKSLFYGKTTQKLEPIQDPSKARTKTERFQSLLVNIGDHPRDMYDALDGYFTEDIIHLSEDGDVRRTLALASLPEILQIHIQRVQYDVNLGAAFKSIQPLPFSEKLYMDRYMETDDQEIIDKKKECHQWKQETLRLKSRLQLIVTKNSSEMTVKDSLIAVKQLAESESFKKNDLSISEETLAVLDEQIARIDVEVDTLQQQIKELEAKIDAQFQTHRKIGYELFAIFIHRGEASFGHYWIYIRDPKRDIYRKYNDETVTEVKYEEIFNFSESNRATPYFVVYTKQENYAENIEPLKRVITEKLEILD